MRDRGDSEGRREETEGGSTKEESKRGDRGPDTGGER